MSILDVPPLASTQGDVRYPKIADVTSGNAQQNRVNIGSRSVALTGHSLMYGQDTTAGGTTAATNGASQTRSALPTTTQFANQAGYLATSSVGIVNQSFPGGRTTEALTRWASGSSGDIEFFWLDTNDGNNYGGYGSGTLNDTQTAENLRQLIIRARQRGADVVVVGGSPDTSDAASRKGYASAQTQRTIAERMGAKYVDAGELLTAVPRLLALFSSGVHLSAFGYSMVGARLAALLGPKGVNPPKVAPGRIFTPRDRLHVGGTVTARTNASDGSVITLTTSATTSFCVEVVTPCIPLIRFRVQGTTIGYGRVGIYANLGTAGQPSHFFTLTAPATSVDTNGAYAYALAPPMLSPGPDAVVIRAESGNIEVDSIQFIPMSAPFYSAGGTVDAQRYRPLKLHPVGGVNQRFNTSWDAMVDIASGTTLLAGSAGATAVSLRWQLELTLGPANSGIILAQTIGPGTGSYIINQGYMLLRNGTTLILRKYESGTVNDTSVGSVFSSATGNLRVVMELDYDSTTGLATVIVDNAVATTFTPAYSFFMMGLIAGGAGSGGLANGTGTIYMAATNEYL